MPPLDMHPLHLSDSSGTGNGGTQNDDVEAAGLYLESERLKFDRKDSLDGSVGPSDPNFAAGGFHHVQRILGAQTSIKNPPLPIVSFMGAPTTTMDMQLGGTDYSKGGAIFALDQIKHTSSAFMSSPMVPVLGTTFSSSVAAIQTQGEAMVGDRRAEFLVGQSPNLGDNTTLNTVRVFIHGAPAAGGILPGVLANEKFAIIQGADALKCVTTNTIDGAPCVAADYLEPLTTSVGKLDPLEFDLAGANGDHGTLDSGDITSIPQPNAPTHKIDVPAPIYVVQAIGANQWTAYTGVIPAPSIGTITNPPASSFVYSRRTFSPIGGDLQEELQHQLGASADDCSKPVDSCAGIPLDYFPPLESEVNGTPSDAPFERSWQHYLDDADQAAAFADGLGEKVVQDGLKVDERSEQERDKIRELCGPNADQDGCGSISTTSLATTGDAPVCLWSSANNQLCKCNTMDGTCPSPCPVRVADKHASEPPLQACTNTLNDAGILFTTAIPVSAHLDIAPLAVAKPNGKPVPFCADFERLRDPNHLDAQGNPDFISDPGQREKTILDLATRFGRQDVAQIASH